MKFCVPTLLGLEGIAADELKRLSGAFGTISNIAAVNGRVYYEGTARDMAAGNIALACGERVLLVLGTFKASTFDELFEGVRALPLSRFIPKNGAYPVTGYSRNSRLTSIPDCQKIIKKAASVNLGDAYGLYQLPENGALYQMKFAIVNDEAEIYLDTTGEGLHKRGYRKEAVGAPIRETLAAAAVRISRYRGREAFRDPFCGSGTIAIEAAFAALNRAPGLNRSFAFESWETMNPETISVRDELRSREYSGEYDILGSDIDPEAIEISEANAHRAGISEYVKFRTADATAFTAGESTKGGIIVTNPPYGERVMEKSDAAALYRRFGAQFTGLSSWGMYIFSSHTEFEREFGAKAEKKRKLYNGTLKCDLFMYNIKK